MKLPAWLNRTVFGDLGYESVTVLLPSFPIILGAPVYALGIIEGLSDGASSFVKLFSRYFADTMGRRREFALGGSVVTAVFPPSSFVAIVAVTALAIGMWMSRPLVTSGRSRGRCRPHRLTSRR